MGRVMGLFKAFPIADIRQRGSIKDQDVQRLRRAFFEDGLIGADEADALLQLNAECRVQDPAWPLFLIEAITDYIVNQAVPEGYVNAANAEWLKARLAPEGRVETKTGLELLVNVIDKARWVPVGLAELALQQVKAAVITGDGPLRADRNVPHGTIETTEVEMLRRILYAFGSDGNVAITRAEAEVLFDIDAALATSAPNPAWTDLFVKAIANVVMHTSGYAIPTREEALAASQSMESVEAGMSPAAFLRTMLSSRFGDVLGAYRMQSSEERALARLERQRIEIITNEEVTEGEADWLASRLGRDGRVSLSEAALVAYLKKESQQVHPGLADALSRLSA